MVLRDSLNEQHSSRLGSAVFGLFPKLHEQAGSFASSKIAGSVLAYGSRAGWVEPAPQETRSFPFHSPASANQMGFGSWRHKLGKLPACFPEYPRARPVLFLAGLEHYFN